MYQNIPNVTLFFAQFGHNFAFFCYFYIIKYKKTEGAHRVMWPSAVFVGL